MKSVDRRRMNTNLRHWDESVPWHVSSPRYDVASFLRGRTSLEPLEPRAMGSVRRKSLLHLQCHFGLDTLDWARRGAKVTGVDFSKPAVQAARRLAHRAGIDARFIYSNLYGAPSVLKEQFDVVYTGKGALCWLPDIDLWGEVVARFLKPGGRFFLLEDHPIVDVFPNDAHSHRLEPRIPYFRTEAQREVVDGTYATDAKLRHRVCYFWTHPVSKTLNALTRNSLTIETVREYPYTFWRRWPFMTKDRQGYWHLDPDDGLIPLMWSVTARMGPPSEKYQRYSPKDLGA
jgi:SAM-dependent methyltransferase